MFASHFQAVTAMTKEEFGIEIDFLAVGEGSKSADAIVIRYGNLMSNDWRDKEVIIIDGGTKTSGDELVEFVKTHYNTTYVDKVIMTHPDRDHASGLTQVLNGLTVGEVWMHQPWLHSADIRQRFIDGRITDSSLERRLRVSMDAAHEVEQIALKNGIKIIEPFAGTQSSDGVITVLGPTRDYYQSLLPDFSKTPEADSALSKAFGFVAKALAWITETFAEEHLPGDNTSAENNSSTIILFQVGGEKFLIVGDAGIPALEAAKNYALQLGIGLNDLKFMQVPHHGSKKNVNSDILNSIQASTAFISAAKEAAPKHPSQRVINALKRRGTTVYVTAGTGVSHRHNAPNRSGWGPADAREFESDYEE
jgi:beta-lactamase superfamily II metal-dependent hydrolase